MGILLAFLAGIVIGFTGPAWLGDLIDSFQKHRILKEVTPREIDEKRICKHPHSWMNAPLWNEKGESQVKVCQICGFIPEMNKMATLEAIDRIAENNKIRDMEKKIYKDFITKEDGDIKKYFDSEIKNGVSFEKLAHVHGAGMTFGTRYGIYKKSRAGEIEKELKKSDA